MTEALIRLALTGFKALSHLPYGALKALAAVLAPVLWWLAVPRRRVTLHNLALCFPHWSQAERQRIARLHFKLFVRSFLDRFIFWHGSPERIRQMCTVHGLEHLQAAAGKPVLILAPHFVGMDAGGLRIQLETRVFGMYARQRSAALTQAMTEGRQRFNQTEMLLRTEGIRPALRRLRQNIPFYFAPDMDLGARDALFVPFFGVPAATVTTLHRLAQMTGASVIPCVTRTTATGYRMDIGPAWTDFPGTDEQADTRRMNAFIEAQVLLQPQDYLWSHRRFKTRPPGEPPLY